VVDDELMPGNAERRVTASSSRWGDTRRRERSRIARPATDDARGRERARVEVDGVVAVHDGPLAERADELHEVHVNES